MDEAVPTGTPSWARPSAGAGPALIFENIQRAFGEDLPFKDPERILRGAQKSLRRLKTPKAQSRIITQASGELRLLYHETRARIGRMERHGEVDDPDACYEYLERIELALMRLELLTRKVETTANEQEDSRQESTPLRGKPLLPQGESIEQRDAPEFMDVEELAAFLHVSPSTIYHRTRSGDIPTRRIGARLLFSKEEIKAWLTSAKPGSTSAA